MRQPIAPALLLAASALIQSCGQTGPLYMPDRPPPGPGATQTSQDPTATSGDAATNAGPTPAN